MYLINLSKQENKFLSSSIRQRKYFLAPRKLQVTAFNIKSFKMYYSKYKILDVKEIFKFRTRYIKKSNAFIILVIFIF
jgi:hypothetical protein